LLNVLYEKYIDLKLKMSEVDFWQQFYKTHGKVYVPKEPSTFATFVCQWLQNSASVLKDVKSPQSKVLYDLGCGTGRDAVFFASQGLSVVAIDQVKQQLDFPNLQYFSADISKLSATHCYPGSADVIYARFVIHSISKESASELYKWCFNSLKSGGLICLEARSIYDPLYEKGEKSDAQDQDVSVCGHYRRFIRSSQLVDELISLGFQVEFQMEADGLSVHNDDNPVLVRVIARKGKGKRHYAPL
jgi:SAM-dependent methyltransferase